MSADTDERLSRIEGRIEHIEAMIARVEAAVGPVLAGFKSSPFGKMLGGGK